MATAPAELILHPVRMRMLVALAHRQLTARQLGELLPDVPQATLYHHLGKLQQAELLRVVSERPVRGTVEKVYALAADSITLSPEELASASREDHLRYFTIFVTTLLSDFARYLQQDRPIDYYADGAGYRETPFYLSDEELIQASTAVSRALLPFLENQPAPNRRRRLFAFVVFPDAEPADAPQTRDAAPAPPTTPSE